jgi:hypothetical protein
MNVLVENIKELNIKELFVKDVELKLLKLQQEEKEWGISIYMLLLLMFGL